MTPVHTLESQLLAHLSGKTSDHRVLVLQAVTSTPVDSLENHGVTFKVTLFKTAKEAHEAARDTPHLTLRLERGQGRTVLGGLYVDKPAAGAETETTGFGRSGQ